MIVWIIGEKSDKWYGAFFDELLQSIDMKILQKEEE